MGTLENHPFLAEGLLLAIDSYQERESMSFNSVSLIALLCTDGWPHVGEYMAAQIGPEFLNLVIKVEWVGKG